MGQLYTIGHSQHKFEYFLDLLRKYEVNYLLDVRSTPYSKYADLYNKEHIEKLLLSNGITYSFMGRFFGARPDNIELYCKEGYLDFEKTSHSELFTKGMQSVELGLRRGNHIALMCTEKDPFDCHRAIMVARAFSLEGVDVRHILADGRIQTQHELEERLLDRYFPDRSQLSLMDFMEPISEEEKLRSAYRARNREIGYQLNQKRAAVV